jgi:PAS domain S-box-containing protein
MDASKGDEMSPNKMGFEQLLEAVPDALVGMDQKGVIRFVNRQTESLFGYDRDQLIGQPIDTLVPETLRQIYAEHQQDYFADPRTRSAGVDLELSGRQRDGTEFPINVSLSHIDTGDVLLVVTAARDVAKRRQAIKNARLLAAIVESSDDAIISGTREGVITSWNPAAARMYGYSTEEIIGQSASVLIPRDQPGEMNAIRAKIQAGQTVEHFETSRVRKDGTVVPISFSIAPIFDEGGAVVGTSAIHRNVTKQRQAFEVAQRMTAIVEGSGDAIFGCLLDGTILSWNPAAERMYGYSREEILGARAKIMTPPDHRDEMMAVLDQIKAGHQVEHLETKRVRKDGTVFPVSLTISPIRDAEGAVVGTSVIHRDLTEQKGALASAQRMAAIVEYSDEAIIGRTLDGIITSWNPAAERMFGYSSEEIVGKPIDLLSSEDRAGETISILAKISAGRPVDDFETARVRKDGTTFPASLTISPIRDESGAVVSASVICRDQSEVKRAAQYARDLIEVDPDPLGLISLDGTVLDLNEATVKAIGVPRDELIGSDFSQYWTDPDKARESVRLTIAEGSVTNYPLSARKRDGALMDTLCNARLYRDINGDVLGVLVAARDVTGQKKALAAAQRMASIVEFSQDAIIGRTLDGIITSWNPAAERMFGYSSEEMVGKCVDLTIPQDRLTEAHAVAAKVGAGEPVEELETVRVRKDGTAFPVSLTLSPIRDADGAVVGASGICRDVSEVKRAAQYARGLIEADPDPLGMISPDGTVLDVNEATVKATGVPRDELIGTDFSQYFADPGAARKGVRWAFEHGSLTDGRLTVRHRDGTLTDLLCNATVYRDINGEVLGVLTSARDVTIQMQAQREMAEQQAKELDRMKELETFRKLALGRELKMIELKKEVEYLRQLGPAGGAEPDDPS